MGRDDFKITGASIRDNSGNTLTGYGEDAINHILRCFAEATCDGELELHSDETDTAVILRREGKDLFYEEIIL